MHIIDYLVILSDDVMLLKNPMINSQLTCLNVWFFFFFLKHPQSEPVILIGT